MNTITKKYVFGISVILIGLAVSGYLLLNNTTLMNNDEYQTTDSGLQYKVLEEAPGGATPKSTSQVEVHYHGTLTDGTVFDSSKQRGQSITFGVNQVIPGWTEGLQLMSEGDRYQLYIPASLAYGEGGVPGVIPPNSDLIFEVELLRVLD